MSTCSSKSKSTGREGLGVEILVVELEVGVVAAEVSAAVLVLLP